MHSTGSLRLLALAAAFPASAMAQDPAACAGLDDAKRLACYDAIYRQGASAGKTETPANPGQISPPSARN